MSMEKKPFVNYTLPSERKESDVETISLKINRQERELIERLKALTTYDQDAKVIKAGMIVLEKVILNNFGGPLFMKLTSSDRRKPLIEDLQKNSDFEKK